MSDDSLVNEILALIFRKDGSLSYDWSLQGSLEDLLDHNSWEDTDLETILEASAREVPSIFGGSTGSNLLDLLPQSSRDRLANVISGVGISNSKFVSPMVETIGTTIADLEKAENSSMDFEQPESDNDGGIVLLHDLMDLEINCHNAGKNKKKQESCRHLYWEIWELAWTRRIFTTDESTIDALESLYSRYKFLHARSVTRKPAVSLSNLPGLFEEEDGKTSH
ncbi:MAG: hypothetical protein HQL70_05105 [Magnetococcales bacterium]|nr:hypothetical protein [Magnetococcales bacterium]